MPDQPDNRSLLAFDFGLKRIGVATGSLITGTASALTTLQSKDDAPDWQAIEALLAEWSPDIIIVGLPLNTDGSESEMTVAARKFATELQSRFSIPLEFADERYTSVEAEAILKDQRRLGIRNKKLKKADIDATAAILIAESWMRSTGDSSPA